MIYLKGKNMKTVISETHTKATASLQKQVETELRSEVLEVSIASLLHSMDDKAKEKEMEKNENPKGND